MTVIWWIGTLNVCNAYWVFGRKWVEKQIFELIDDSFRPEESVWYLPWYGGHCCWSFGLLLRFATDYRTVRVFVDQKWYILLEVWQLSLSTSTQKLKKDRFWYNKLINHKFSFKYLFSIFLHRLFLRCVDVLFNYEGKEIGI